MIRSLLNDFSLHSEALAPCSIRSRNPLSCFRNFLGILSFAETRAEPDSQNARLFDLKQKKATSKHRFICLSQ